MTLALQYPDRESIKREIRIEVSAYTEAIMILGSLKSHLERSSFKCFIEKKINKKENGYKTPDLLILSDNYIVVDHKYTESADEKNLYSRIKEMGEYKTTFIYESTEFTPEIVMLIPKQAIESFKKMSGCPVTWDYALNEEIIINQCIGSVKDSPILSLFKPTFMCPKAREISKYKFIISHSPLPYMACQVYTILWTLHPPSDYFASEFCVDYDQILDQFNNIFPPWVSSEVKQLNDTRLKQSLIFLQIIDWIKWREHEKKVILYKNKGRLQGDTLEYFIEQYTYQEYMKKMQEYEKYIEQTKKMEEKEHPPLEHFWKNRSQIT